MSPIPPFGSPPTPDASASKKGKLKLTNHLGGTADAPTVVNHSAINSGDVHTQYALLAGRSGGQALVGGTASGDDLTLTSSSNSTKGNIFIEDQLEMFPNDRTYTTAQAPITFDNTYTMNQANWAFWGLNFAPTIIAQQGGWAGGSGVIVRNAGLYKNLSSVAAGLGSNFLFYNAGAYRADTQTISTANVIVFIDQGTADAVSGGTHNLTTWETLRSLVTVSTGAVVTNLSGGVVYNPLGAGTITNLIGFDVKALTRGGTNNIGLRIDTPSGATNNYAIQLSGTGGTAAAGITFGTDTNLYRSAADTLKTDDSFIVTKRMQETQGADVASANNLVLGSDGNTFEITGTTQINLISNLTWQNGCKVTLLFTSTPTVKHNQATSTTNITIQLAGAADFVASAGDTLTLVLSEIGGTQAWREISRAVI